MSTVCTNDQTIPLKANGQVDWVTIIPLHIFDQRLQSPYYNSTQYYVHAKEIKSLSEATMYMHRT